MSASMSTTRTESQSIGHGDSDAEKGANTAEEIWEFWQHRRQSLSILKKALSVDSNANATEQFRTSNS